MTNNEYQEQVEKKFNKPLHEIMHQLCVIEDVVPVEGASRLEVPKHVFVQWRTKLRLGPLQREYDHAVKFREKTIDEYKNQLAGVDINRDFVFSGETSLRGLREVVERLLEVYKIKRTAKIDRHDDFDDILNVWSLEKISIYLEDYQNGKLHEEFSKETQIVKNLLDNGNGD